MNAVIKVFFLVFLLSSVTEASRISDLAKALLYVENGEYEKANQKIALYRDGQNLIISMIQARAEKNEALLKSDFKIIPEIKDKLKDRIEYEIAMILFEKGDIVSAKAHLQNIKDRNPSSVNFMLANLNLLEKDIRASLENFAKVRREEIDELSYVKLKKLLSESSAPVVFNPWLSVSLFFGSLPTRFEAETYQKSWDIVYQVLGDIEAKFVPYKELSPFVSYRITGEFYTEIKGYTIHNLSAGVEYEELVPLGLIYSFRTIANGPVLESIGHVLSSFAFPTKNLYLSISTEMRTYDIIGERSGISVLLDLGSNFLWRFRRIGLRSTPFVSIGRRFARTQRFSDTFFSMHLGNSLKISDTLLLSADGFGMFSAYQAAFEGREKNLFLGITTYISLDREYLRWDILKPILQINFSDDEKFSWRRFMFGTSFELNF